MTQPAGTSALEEGGHLAAIDSHLPAKGQTTMANSLPVVIASDQAPSLTNPTITEDQLRGWILNGQAYNATTGNVSTAGAAADVAFSLYTDVTNTKNILIYSIKFFGGNGANTHELRTGTTNLALSNATVNNLKLGGASTSLTSTTGAVTYSSTAQTVAGNALDVFISGVNTVFTLLNDGTVLYLPAGTSRSVTLYLNIAAAGNWGATFRYVEI
jgi:hypothetical protein